MEDWEAFCGFLNNRQPPRSLSESTADDAVEFLRSLPSDRIMKVVESINAVKMDDDHKENPFSSPLVRTFLNEDGKKQIGGEEYGEKKLNIPGGQQDNLCEKCLTTSDDLHRLVVTATENASKYFPSATVLRGADRFLQVEDEEGKPWMFEFSYLKVSQIYEFTEAWSSYVKEKQLGMGDFVFIQRHRKDNSRLSVGFRRRNNSITSLHTDFLSQDSARSAIYSADGGEDPVPPGISFNDNGTALQPDYFPCKDLTPPTTSFVEGGVDLQLNLCQDPVTPSISFNDDGTAVQPFYFPCKDPTPPTTSFVDGGEDPAPLTMSIGDSCPSLSDDFFPSQNPAPPIEDRDCIYLLPDLVTSSETLEQSWKAVVKELTSMDRNHQYKKGDEVMLAKNIVRDVLVNSKTRSNLSGSLQLSHILPLLKCSQSSAPHIVGLWGMAGIGKTTISREIFRTQGESYDVCYFLPDFHLLCQTKGLNPLREDFFSKIFGDEMVFIDAWDTKLSFTRDRFRGKRVLIVLDGVSNVRDAEVLVGGFGWFSGGHTIILTSRNRQVLVQCNAKEIYEIKKLSESDSLHLCRQFATEKNWKVRMSLIKELVNYASGNPLALRVLCSSIEKQCIRDEKEHLIILPHHPPIEISVAFGGIFSELDDNEKNTFLDLACFFKGENKDHVVNILDGCGFLTDLAISGLIDESLISLVDNRIEMPNIFQEMGRFVVCQEHEEAGKRSRLSDSNDIVGVLTNNSGTERIEGIFLDASGLKLELSSTVFEEMDRLRLLKLHYPTSENDCKASLPDGLLSLPDELRLLHWERYPLGSLPRNFNPENLVELNMPYSNLTKLWEGTENLEMLKRIILSHSRQLTDFSWLSKATNLEHIDLEGCTSLVEVNSSMCHHRKLTFLSLKNCCHLRIMPSMASLESLEVLNLSGCSELEYLQDFSPNLTEIYLAETAIKEIPSSIVALDRLVTLDLENCNRLQHLPPEISSLKAVVRFRPSQQVNLREAVLTLGLPSSNPGEASAKKPRIRRNTSYLNQLETSSSFGASLGELLEIGVGSSRGTRSGLGRVIQIFGAVILGSQLRARTSLQHNHKEVTYPHGSSIKVWDLRLKPTSFLTGAIINLLELL